MTCTRRETHTHYAPNKTRPFVSQHYSDLFPDSCSFASRWHDALFLIRTVTLRKSRNSWFAPRCQLARRRPSSLQSGCSVRVPACRSQVPACRHCGLSGWKMITTRRNWFFIFYIYFYMIVKATDWKGHNHFPMWNSEGLKKGKQRGDFQNKSRRSKQRWMRFQLRSNNLMRTPWHSHRMIHKCFLFLRSKHQFSVLGSLSPYSILLG